MPPSPRPTRAATAASTASTRTTQTTTTTTTTTRSTTRTNKASTNTTTQVPTSGRACAIQAVRDKMEAHRLATTAAKRTLTRLERSSPPPSPHLPHSPATRASSRRIPNSRPTPEKAQRRMSAPQPSKDVVRKLTTLATKPASRTATKSLTAAGKPRPPPTSPHLSTTKPLKAPSPSARPPPHSQAPAKSPRQSSLVRHAIPARQPRPPVPTRKLPDITKAPEPPTQLIDSEMTAAMPAKPSEESLASRFFADENESEGGLRPSLNEDLAPMAIVEPADMSRMQALEGMSSSIPSDENSEHAALYTASLTPIALEDLSLSWSSSCSLTSPAKNATDFTGLNNEAKIVRRSIVCLDMREEQPVLDVPVEWAEAFSRPGSRASAPSSSSSLPTSAVDRAPKFSRAMATTAIPASAALVTKTNPGAARLAKLWRWAVVRVRR